MRRNVQAMRPAQLCEDPPLSTGISMGVSKSGSPTGDEFGPGIRKLPSARTNRAPRNCANSAKGSTAADRSPLSPGRVNRRADEEGRARARPWPELLQAPVAHLRDVEVPLLVHARAVHVEEAAWMIAERAPGVEEVSLE